MSQKAKNEIDELKAKLAWYQDAFDELALLLLFRGASADGQRATTAVAGALSAGSGESA